MRQLLILFLSLLFLPLTLQAQRKEISAAQDLVKSGKNLETAQANMEKLLKDSANRTNLKIWETLYEAVRKQYEQGNEKLYLKQQYDTAKLFRSVNTLFSVAIAMDSVDARPDRRGRVRPQFRDHHADYLNAIRGNLFFGGAYFIRKQQYPEAYSFFNRYIDCVQQPLFRRFDYAHHDRRVPQAAYWAVFCGYKMKDTKASLHHTYWALQDTAHQAYMLQYLAETYRLDNDSARYMQTLQEGFHRYPLFPFFFPRLVEGYVRADSLPQAMAVTEEALKIAPAKREFLFTKSTLLLNMGKYRDCITICDSVIEKDADRLTESKDSVEQKSKVDEKSIVADKDSVVFAGFYLNAGLAYYNMAVNLDKNYQSQRRNRTKILQYYERALPYLERYRRLRPADRKQWAFPLYTIYLNLNKGKEFDEINKVISATDGQK